jgi:hypothetical protein
MSIVTDLNWIEEEKIPDRLLLFARNLPVICGKLQEHIHDPIRKILLGKSSVEPSHSNSLRNDIRISQAWVAAGNTLDPHFIQQLEERSVPHPLEHIATARLHVLSSSEREVQARMALSEQSIPYIFPGEIAPLHIEIFAVGDRALHVLHVEWLKKLSTVAIEALELDCQNKSAWLLPFLEVLPEKDMIREIKKLVRKKRFIGGGIGLLAFYGVKMGMDSAQLLSRGNDYDELFYTIAKESEHHRLD